MDPSPLKQLGSTIRQRRQELGLSQEDLAEKSGLHRNYIGGVERGERNVGFVNLTKIAEGLDLPLSRLMRMMEDGASD